jgi:transposase-like protein
MPTRIPDAKRAKIAADIRAKGMSRNEIARKYRVSAASVGNIAAEEGIEDAFDRTHVAKAAHAKAADNKVRRAQLASDLLDDAQRLRQRAWSPYSIAMSTPQGVEVIELELPPLPDVRSAYTAIGIASDKTIAIEKHDTQDDGADHAKSMLGRLFTGLAEAVSDEPPETPQDEG